MSYLLLYLHWGKNCRVTAVKRDSRRDHPLAVRSDCIRQNHVWPGLKSSEDGACTTFQGNLFTGHNCSHSEKAFFLSSFYLMPLTFLSAVKSLIGKLPSGYWQAPGKVPQNFPVSSLPLVLLLPSAARAPVWPHLPCVCTQTGGSSHAEEC